MPMTQKGFSHQGVQVSEVTDHDWANLSITM